MTRAIRTALFGMLPVVALALSVQGVVAQGPQVAARLGVSVDETRPVAQEAKPSMKEPGTATIISILIVGGGQIYAGETTRGLLMLGGAYGSIIAGAVLASSASCDFDSLSCDTGSLAPLYIGALAALGIYVYSIIDAAPSARRMNAKHGYKVSSLAPVMRGGPSRTSQFGLRVAF